ncbi:hypothetical protein A5680_18730 [Mycobacterium sp. E2989]|nr:hypothetical protein A5680_18730 [Mycobacterium sp. E2989]
MVPEPASLAAGPRSPTRMPCRAAIRPTTNRPMCRALSGLTSPPACSRMLAIRRSVSFMPRPESATRTTTPPSPPRAADTRTGVAGGE